MSYSGLLFITENSIYIRLFIFGLLYPAVRLLGTVSYLGYSSTLIYVVIPAKIG